VAALHLRRRLGIEADQEARVFGQGIKFFHLENWYSVHSVIRNALRVAGLLGRARRNALKIELRHNEVPIPGLPHPFEGLRILHLTDLHLDIPGDFPHILGERIRDLNYDLCVMTGDYRYKTFGPCEAALEGLQRLRSQLKGPIYAVLGNHDTIRMVPAMEAMGIRVLLNEAVTITKPGAALHLVGIDDPHYYRADNLERACQGVDHEEPTILLAHSPEVYQHAAHAGFNLMLCGHTHGGQICLPGRRPIIYDAKCPRKLANGAWKYHDLIGYTSPGAGSSIVEVRINCPPEVTVHHLKRSD
jgi:predicted MPP superfamily phosphohydrolase